MVASLTLPTFIRTSMKFSLQYALDQYTVVLRCKSVLILLAYKRRKVGYLHV